MPRVRALREIRDVLRDWKRHGMRDTVVDKDTWRIWARVDFENRELLSWSIDLRYPADFL